MEDLKEYIVPVIEKQLGKMKRDVKSKFGDAVAKEIYDIYHRAYDIPPPGGESIKDVQIRVKSFIKDLLKKMKKEKVNIAISAHNNSMRPFRAYFEKLNRKQMMALENPWDDYFHYVIEV